MGDSSSDSDSESSSNSDSSDSDSDSDTERNNFVHLYEKKHDLISSSKSPFTFKRMKQPAQSLLFAMLGNMKTQQLEMRKFTPIGNRQGVKFQILQPVMSSP